MMIITPSRRMRVLGEPEKAPEVKKESPVQVEPVKTESADARLTAVLDAMTEQLRHKADMKIVMTHTFERDEHGRIVRARSVIERGA